MKNINLFTQYYHDSNKDRRFELDYCVYENLENDFDSVFLIYQTPRKQSFELSVNKHKLSIEYVDERPMFNNFFEIMDREEYAHSINILANTDIIFTKGLGDILAYVNTIESNTCIALSRYDYNMADNTTTEFHRADSQDTWIFKGNPKVRTSIPYGMGMAGCDNKLAYDISQHGYNLINPCKSIHTYHIHHSNIRNYLNEINEPSYRVPPPYKLINVE